MNPKFYFLLALTSTLAAATNALVPVRDTDGDIIFDGSYYVVPYGEVTIGGSLSLFPRGDEHCSFSIVQLPSGKGLPIKFSNWMPLVAFVPESTVLDIETVVGYSICMQQNKWWLYDIGKGKKTWWVGAGRRSEGESNSFSFLIKNAGVNGGYKFVACHEFEECSDVGIYVDADGIRRFELGSNPFVFVLEKANAEKSSFTNVIESFL